MEKLPELINYIIVALSFLLAILAFLPKLKGAKRAVGDSMAVVFLTGFIVICIGIAFGLGVLVSRELLDRERVKINRLLGVRMATEGFNRGVDASILEGTWRCEWSAIDEKTGEARPYKIDIPGQGLQRYPADMVTFIAEKGKSHVWISAYNPTTKDTYWMEGRMSAKNILTLIYWSRDKYPIAELSGIVFAKLSSDAAHRMVLKGNWCGYTRQRKETRGGVVFTRID